MKKRFLSFFAVLLAVSSLLAGCNNGANTTLTEPIETESLFPGSDTEEILTADKIVYPKEELPKIYITTENGFQVISKEKYTSCGVRFELSDRFAEFENTYTDDNGGLAEIRCRGNASYNNSEMRAVNKFSYKLKLETKANVLGLGESKHWYLINNWRDISAMRHKLAYDFALSIGLSSVDSTWVSLYYNGEYRGLYLLTESVRIAEDRVDTTNWEEFASDVAKAYAANNGFSPEDTKLLEESMEKNLKWISNQSHTANLSSGSTAIDLTGYFDPDSLDLTSGYLIEYCTGFDTNGTKWKTTAGIPVVMDNPFYLATNSKMYQYVHTLVQDFEDAILSPTYHNSKGKHYSEYVDVDSLVDYWIIWNLFRNTEFGSRSLYYYIDHGKIIFSPVWDFDATLGNIITLSAASGVHDKWVHDAKSKWFTKLFGDPYFTAKCQERWFSMREAVDELYRSIDVYVNYIEEENLRCVARNGIRTFNVKNPLNGGVSFTPAEDYEYMKTWYKNRVEWIDEHFSVIDPNVDGGGYVRSDEIFPKTLINGSEPTPDMLTVFGAPADYIISPDTTGTVEISATTTYGSSTTMEAFLNGTVVLGKQPFRRGDTAKYVIDVSSLDMTEGAVNIIYLCAFRSNGTVRGVSSVVIKVTSMENPKENERLVDLNGTLTMVEAGSSFTLPEITEVRDGYVAEGWTTGDDKVYAAGDTVTVDENTFMFIRWKRTDTFSRFNMER